MIEFQLFRLKIFPPRQGNLFNNEMDRSQFLSDVVHSLPEVELREGSIWHIGNVSAFENSAIYFRLGRTTRSTIERYRNGDFIDEPFELAPYTHILVDSELEIIAVAKKPKLSPRTKGIARAFTKLLNESVEGIRLNVQFEIGEMSNPEEFIIQLERAYCVSRFWVQFSKPNPFDADADFVQPMQNLLRESDGRGGKTEIKGDELNPDVLQKLSRSAAATGDNAGATLQDDQNSPKVKKNLQQNPVVIVQEDISEADDKRILLRSMRDIYQRIRRGGGHEQG